MIEIGQYTIGNYHMILNMYHVLKNGEGVAWFKTIDECKRYIASRG